MSTRTSIATFKELCLDSHPPTGVEVTALGRFWAAAAGCDYVRSTKIADDPGDAVGIEEGMGIAVCPVPEPKTVKHRVHVDVNVGSLAELTALGATVLNPTEVGEPDAQARWTVMADPEGGEFCAFVRRPEQLTPYRVFEMNVDCVDAEASARWWAEVFGVEAQHKDDQWWWIEGAPGFPSSAVARSWALVFAEVPEPKTVKNRWHWDVSGDVDEFLARGATVLWEMPRWVAMQDPEGNEFCVFAPRG